MKQIIFFLFITANAFVAKGQTEYLVTVDPATGAFTKIKSIPGVAHVNTAPDAATLDETNNSLIFVGQVLNNAQEYFFDVNNVNGDLLSQAPVSGAIDYLFYGNSSKILYGIESGYAPPELCKLVSINVGTGGYTLMKALSNISLSYDITCNLNMDQLIIYGFDSSGNKGLFTVDGKTGNTISETILDGELLEMQYDNKRNELYGFDLAASQLGMINIATGQFTAIYNMPSGETIETGMSTFDERDQEYIVPTADNSGQWHLYFIDVATGKLVYRDTVEALHGVADNVIEYRYDNVSNLLYALHWEESTMPVTLVSFTASAGKDENVLRWSTANEINAGYFNVQRSVDGENFYTIGKVNAKGNSSTEIDYTYVDAIVSAINASTIYYRLQEVDKDGKFAYSEVRNINKAGGFKACIYPNPVKDNLSLSFSSDKAMNVQVEIVNNEGEIITTQQLQVGAGASMQSINAAWLSNGSYYVRCITEEGVTELKFVKEK